MATNPSYTISIFPVGSKLEYQDERGITREGIVQEVEMAFIKGSHSIWYVVTNFEDEDIDVDGITFKQI